MSGLPDPEAQIRVRTLWGTRDVLPILGANPMYKERESTLAQIKDDIRQGKYRVDTRAVADAIMRHIHAVAAAKNERPAPYRPLIDVERRSRAV